MLTPEQVQKYAPSNYASLTAEDLAALKNISDEELKQLAETYPNQPRGNGYLVLFDKSVKKQMYPVSTYANLYGLRVKNNKKNFSIETFFALHVKPLKQQGVAVAPTQDLTDKEVKDAAGLKVAAPQEVKEAGDDAGKKEEVKDDGAVKQIDDTVKVEEKVEGGDDLTAKDDAATKAAASNGSKKAGNQAKS